MFRLASAIAVLSASLAAPFIMTGCSAPLEAGCQSSDQCRAGRVCIDNVCQAPDGAPTNSAANNTSSNNATNNVVGSNNTNNVVTPNNATPNNVSTNNVAPPPNNVGMDPNLELCTEFCDRLFRQCIQENCMLPDDVQAQFAAAVDQCIYDGFEGDPGCLDAVAQDPAAAEDLRDQLDNELSCDGEPIRRFQCVDLGLGGACDCPQGEQPIGGECDTPLDCNSGDLQALCPAEDNDPPFPSGYCVAVGCSFDPNQPRAEFNPECGSRNVCVPVGDADAGQQVGLCLDGCLSHDECRGDYQCRLIGLDRVNGQATPVRVCLAECSADLPCDGQQERCNEGRCEFRCSDSSGGGGPSGRQRCEFLGYTCVPDANGQEWCQLS